MSNLGTRLYTFFKGALVGTDLDGNRYYREKNAKLVPGGGMPSRERRWVLYSGVVEASRVAPGWHGWLHHMTNEPPPPGGPAKRPWQKEHLPNMTGTTGAYHPPGSIVRGGNRAAATGDYEPWTPS